MLLTLAGTLIAILPALVAYAIWRLLRALWRLLRMPRKRAGVLVARARAWMARIGARLPRIRRIRLPRRPSLARAERRQAAALAVEVARLKAELRVARAELALAEAATLRGGFQLPWQRPADDRFQQAKLAFARAFHPDRLAEDDPDRAIRAAIFRDFWDVLRRIERGQPVSGDRPG